jgi:hypothetical protein
VIVAQNETHPVSKDVFRRPLVSRSLSLTQGAIRHPLPPSGLSRSFSTVESQVKPRSFKAGICPRDPRSDERGLTA